MEQKEIRLNAAKRKSLVKDYRRHCEDQDSTEKEEFLQSREVCNDSIATAFSTAKEVVERKYELDDVATLKSLNPDCNIEADITYDKGVDRYDRRSNPWLAQCRNDNDSWLQGKQGGANLYEQWEDKYKLNVIGTGGCRSRAIPCTELEFAKFEMMHQAKADMVLKHTKWIQTIVAKVERFEQGIKQMTKFSQVEKFAKHDKVNWEISKEILADKIGMDIVVSIDDLADSIEAIGKPKDTRKQKIAQRLAYEEWQQSQRLAS
jgi:hypothetical protein